MTASLTPTFSATPTLSGLVLTGLLSAMGSAAIAQTPPPAPTGMRAPEAMRDAPHADGKMDHRDPAKMQAMMAKRTAEMKAMVKVIPGSVPVTGKFYGFINWQAAVVTVVVSALIGALLLSALSSKVSKEDYERLQAKERQAVRVNAVVTAEGRYYMGQIEQYKAKNPKATDFPAYKPAE